MDTNSLILLIILFLVVFGGGIYYAIKKKLTYIPNIIDLEKRRKAHPDIQTGRFNRMYTMPYDDEVNAYTVRKYLESLHPDYIYDIQKETLYVKDNRSKEKRHLIFTQLREEDITAIELHDPHEVIAEGRRGTLNIVTRSSLHDLGFSQSIRDAILHFQELAVNKRNR